MLVFGGLVKRDRYYKNSVEENSPEYDIFNYCEDYERIMETDRIEKGTIGESLPYFLRTCGEELVKDVWLYDIKQN